MLLRLVPEVRRGELFVRRWCVEGWMGWSGGESFLRDMVVNPKGNPKTGTKTDAVERETAVVKGG